MADTIPAQVLDPMTVPVGEVLRDRLMASCVEFARHVKLSGTPQELDSLRWVQMDAAGVLHISPHEHLHEMCISPSGAARARKPWPVPDPVRAMAAAGSDGDAVRFGLVDAHRARNRMQHALEEAARALGA